MVLRALVFFSFIAFFIGGLCAQGEPLFQTVSSRHSGISFQNAIKENLETRENLFDFDYFYNGAGVGVADFNNDGLQDIVFCGNQMPNALYVNQGDFVFTHIENAFEDSGKKFWSNGVSIADINQDGFQDIYISQGGPHNPSQRRNLLFINNGDLTFEEQGELYGLADEGISTQSAFFDYDKDGDLDCIVMNENSFYGMDPIRFYQAIGEDDNIFWQNCSHFYINENGIYKDATQKVGMLKPSFGLGLAVSDLNDDGWLDVYIANDYYIPDAMYINNGDGTFEDKIKENTDQISFYGMGVDVADINNDTHQDIFVLDMASSDHYRSKTLMRSMNVSNFRLLVNTLRFPYQYMFNSLQLADGSNHFFNISQQSGLAKTDWSWSVLMNDFDLDGHKDVFVTNGYRRYALDNDFQNEVAKTQRLYNGVVPLSEKQRLYESMPTEPLSNVIYKNKGNTDFKNVTTEWGLNNPSYSNGAAVADFDNDGDLDLVVNNIDSEASLFRNTSIETGKGNFIKIIDETGEPFFSVKIVTEDGVTQFAESKTVRGYMSSSEPSIFFGLNSQMLIKEMEVSWIDGSIVSEINIKTNQILRVSKPNKSKSEEDQREKALAYEQVDPAELGIMFQHRENNFDDFVKEILLPYKQSTLGPRMVIHDINNDHLDDILVLGAADQANELYVQTQASWKKLNVTAFEEDKVFEDMDAVFFDLNSDGWDDIYIITGGNEKIKGDSFYQDRVYINQKGESFLPHPVELLSEFHFSGKVGNAIDFDNDGDDDLLVTNRMVPQMYPYSAPSFVFENRKGKLIDVTQKVAPDLVDFGIINDVEVVDLNGDGSLDFIVVGEWTSPGIFINENGQFKNESESFGLDNISGWWHSITMFNANDDGKPDFVIGNMGLNSKYQASEEKPLKVYAGDMDNNGSWDLVLSKKYKNQYVPFRGKECSTQQMPFVSEKFPTYDLFASASVEDVYGSKLEESYERSINQLSSISLISSEEGYQVKNLPVEVQYFPVLDGITIKNEVVLAGNIYNTEVETPRMDMGRGVSLSYKNNEFRTISASESGLNLSGNTKCLEKVYHKGRNIHYIIAGVNNEKIKVFKRRD